MSRTFPTNQTARMTTGGRAPRKTNYETLVHKLYQPNSDSDSEYESNTEYTYELKSFDEPQIKRRIELQQTKQINNDDKCIYCNETLLDDNVLLCCEFGCGT